MFNLAIDSKLRGCDFVNLRVRDVIHGSQILPRKMIVQRKTQHSVQFELTEPTRIAVSSSHLMCPRASTLESRLSGLPPLALIPPSTARTR